MTEPTPQLISRARSYAFSAVNLPLSALLVTVGVYLGPHYAGALGLNIAAVGAAVAVVRLLDIPVDFLLGLAMDRTKTRFGRYRVWMAIGAPITFGAVWMLFFAERGVGIGHLILWLLIMYIGTSILTLSHLAWASTLARTYDDRSRLFGTIGAVGVLGATLVLVAPDMLRFVTGEPVEGPAGVRAMGAFMLASIPVTVLTVLWATPEPPSAPMHATDGGQFRLRDYWSLIARPSMGRLVAADFFLSCGPAWTGALYVFFFTDSRGYTGEETRLLLVLYMFAGFAGAPLIGRLAIAINKHKAAMLTIAAWGLILGSLMVTPRGNIPIGMIQMFSLGFLAAGFFVLVRAMTADIADEVRLEQGKERSGVLFAFTTLTAKLSAAFGIFASYLLLDIVGYGSGAVNTPEAIQGMVLTYIIVPVVFMLVAAACLWGYPLSKTRHAAIRSELEDRDRLWTTTPPVLETMGDRSVSAPGVVLGRGAE